MSGWREISTVGESEDDLVLVALMNGGIIIYSKVSFTDPLTQEEIRRLNLAAYEVDGSWPNVGFTPTHWMPLPAPPAPETRIGE